MFGRAPLLYACDFWCLEVANKLLIEHGAKVDTKGNDDDSPLYRACQTGKLGVAELLIENGADANAKKHDGETSLHWACQRNFLLEMTKLLIQVDADVNAQKNNGMSPLYLACENGNLGAVQLLLSRGADVTAKTNRRLYTISNSCMRRKSFGSCGVVASASIPLPGCGTFRLTE